MSVFEPKTNCGPQNISRVINYVALQKKIPFISYTYHREICGSYTQISGWKGEKLKLFFGGYTVFICVIDQAYKSVQKGWI